MGKKPAESVAYIFNCSTADIFNYHMYVQDIAVVPFLVLLPLVELDSAGIMQVMLNI